MFENLFLELFPKLCKHFHIVSRAGWVGSNASYWAPHWDSPSMSEIATKIILLAPGTSPSHNSSFLWFSTQNCFAKFVAETTGLIQNSCPLGQTNWIPPLESNYPFLFKRVCSPLDICDYERETIWNSEYLEHLSNLFWMVCLIDLPYSVSIHYQDDKVLPYRGLSSCTPCRRPLSLVLSLQSREPLHPDRHNCNNDGTIMKVLTLVTSKAVAETRMLSPRLEGVLHSIVPMSSIWT